MTAIFWASIFGVVYAYLGYPALLYILSHLCKNREINAKDGYFPKVTMIITAHNEEKRIGRKIENTLNLTYPRDRLEVLIASDASTDATDEIVRSSATLGIGLIRAPYRKGKEFAQKCAIEKATGDIIIFSDVATILEPDGVAKIVSNFVDPSVGCVSSEDRFIDENGKISGEGAYVRYEMWLRSLETKVNTIVGLSGSFFAARAEVCRNWPTTIPSDFNTLLNSIRLGLRGVSDPWSIGIYTNIKDEKKEFDRKVRTITRGISALMKNKVLMNPLRYGLFSWQLLSHKLMRWMVPWLLIIAFCANILLAAKKTNYKVILILQSLLYFVGLINPSRFKGKINLMLPHYFIQVNHAIAVAWIKYIKGVRYVTWIPSMR